MKLFDRDLRSDRLDYSPHLPKSFKCGIVGFYVMLGIGFTYIVASGVQCWESRNRANVVGSELDRAMAQVEMLRSVSMQLEERRLVIADVQAWLSQRLEIDVLYHQCANLAHDGLLMEGFSVNHDPETHYLAIAVGVEGDSRSYNSYFRKLTSFFTTTPGTRVADIQIEPRPGGALLTIDVHTDNEVLRPATAPNPAPRLSSL